MTKKTDKIFRVEVKVSLFWYSKDGKYPAADDCNLSEAAKEELEMGNGYISVDEVKPGDVLVPSEADSCPWGDGGNEKTVKQWVGSTNASN